jgi:hypothetical protein
MSQRLNDEDGTDASIPGQIEFLNRNDDPKSKSTFVDAKGNIHHRSVRDFIQGRPENDSKHACIHHTRTVTIMHDGIIARLVSEPINRTSKGTTEKRGIVNRQPGKLSGKTIQDSHHRNLPKTPRGEAPDRDICSTADQSANIS